MSVFKKGELGAMDMKKTVIHRIALLPNRCIHAVNNT